MGPLLLFWLLRVVLILPWTKALVCKRGYLIHEDDRSAFPITWSVRLNETCQPGEGCQDTLILLESGNRIAAITSQGCTRAPAQETKDIQHRAPPGVTIASYTRVCHLDLCNDLDTTVPLWTPKPTDAPAPGGLQCPVCISQQSCPSNANLVACPSGTHHCYSGTLQLLGGDLLHLLRVQGCVPQDGCHLLNGTQSIGPITLRESCQTSRSQGPRAGTLTCYKGVTLLSGKNMRQEPQDLRTDRTVTCEAGEVCQETVLLTESGTRGMLVSSKGCIASGSAPSGPTRIGVTPGVTVFSYSRVCSSHLCNDLNSTASILQPSPSELLLPREESHRLVEEQRQDEELGDLGSFHHNHHEDEGTQRAAPAPGGLQCPTCVALGSCSNPDLSLCPRGTSRCYQGIFKLNGGGISGDMSIQGCAPKALTGCRLLGNTQAFGPIAVTESCQGEGQSEDQNSPSRASASPVPAWGVGAALLLGLWGHLPHL